MQTIPLIDIRNSSPIRLVRDNKEQARALIRASHGTLGIATKILSPALLPIGDKLSKDWLIKTRNPYLKEIDAYADILDVSGVYALNLCYEWGCTTGAYQKEQGVALARVLDWVFPALGENTIVAHQSGKAGDFYNITWPGVSGVFTAMAPGRFAAALNQAPMRRHNRPFIVDWALNRRLLQKAKGLPPEHLLRNVMETASNYDEAVHRLATEEIALPVIYTVTGTQQGQGCVIERTESDHVIRDLKDDRACTANHFISRLNDIGHGWRPRPIDSMGRMKLASCVPINGIEGNFRWFKPPIANTHTRVAVFANAATGQLAVMGTAGTTPVTKVFRL